MSAPLAPPAPRPGARVALGLGLLTPAVLALLWSYVAPTVTTVLGSFQDFRLTEAEEYIGFQNYDAVWQSGVGGRFGFAIVLALAPLAVGLVVAPLLAVAAQLGGRSARWVVRGLLALPLATYAPVAYAVGWATSRREFHDQAQPRGWVLSEVAWTTAGLALAVGVTIYLAALRTPSVPAVPQPVPPATAGYPPTVAERPATGPSVGRRVGAFVVGGIVLALGVLALSLQTFTGPFVLSAGVGPAETPLTFMISSAFRTFGFGPGYAESTLLLIVLAVLGIAAVVVLLATRTRIELEDGPGNGRVRRPAWFGVVIGLVLALVALGYGAWPWLHTSGTAGTSPVDFSPWRALLHTWAPPLLPAVVGVLFAALAGFGIGAVRPFGRRSELLLLPFAPWLFVGVGPLVLAHFNRAGDADSVGTFLGSIPPGWISIPALVVFTLFFRGQHGRGARGVRLLVPALPMVGIAVVLHWVLGAQGLIWQYATTIDGDSAATTLHAARTLQNFQAVPNPALSWILPIPIAVVLFALALAAQLAYLDRLALRIGEQGAPALPPPPASSFPPQPMPAGAPAGDGQGQISNSSRQTATSTTKHHSA
ncbi:sugar ABC transporter permease [Cryptosporangium minutisporangium]|uniref:sugar ABC transporter permease n=1 Tax=Cryptosporangium minutisporangium TaxID=113569 RepID=UPI0031EE21E6